MKTRSIRYLLGSGLAVAALASAGSADAGRLQSRDRAARRRKVTLTIKS
jgi:hypothetical protein